MGIVNENIFLTNQINLKSSVKSIYILRYILSFIPEKRKLNIIIYNKELQNKLGINIEYYKKISGKFKISKRNGFGKEYKLLVK